MAVVAQELGVPQRYCEVRGVRVGTQGRQEEKTDNVSVLAAELGVQERTARRRLEATSQHLSGTGRMVARKDGHPLCRLFAVSTPLC